MSQPDVALVSVVQATLTSVACPYNLEQSAVQLSLTHELWEPSTKNAETCNGLSGVNDVVENYGQHPPGSPADLFNWLWSSRKTWCCRFWHSARRTRSMGWRRSSQIARGHRAGKPAWPTAQGEHAKLVRDDRRQLFKHVNRTTIGLSVAEARGGEAELSVRAAAKKSEAVTIADRLVAGSGWIPTPLRIALAEAEQELEAESIAEDEQFPQAAE